MRRILGIFSLLLLPATAFAQGANTAIVGFGGLTMNGYSSSSTSLGGSIAYNLIPGMQVVGEVGHLGNVMPTLADTLLSRRRHRPQRLGVLWRGGRPNPRTTHRLRTLRGELPRAIRSSI